MSNDTWRTHPDVFNGLDAEFNFKLDAAASAEDHLCLYYIDEKEDSLKTEWSKKCPIRPLAAWCNPPYSRGMIPQFLTKAVAETKNGVTTVMLLPATIEVYWETIINYANEVRFIVGRLSFIDPQTGAKTTGNRTGSAAVIFRPYRSGPIVTTYVGRNELETRGRTYAATKNR